LKFTKEYSQPTCDAKSHLWRQISLVTPNLTCDTEIAPSFTYKAYRKKLSQQLSSKRNSGMCLGIFVSVFFIYLLFTELKILVLTSRLFITTCKINFAWARNGSEYHKWLCAKTRLFKFKVR
jgi:hypothetical protein